MLTIYTKIQLAKKFCMQSIQDCVTAISMRIDNISWVGCVSSIKTVKDSNPCNIINFPKTKKELTLKILIHIRKTSPNISIWHYVDVFVLTKRHCTMQCLNHLCMYCLPIRTNKMARLRRCKDLVHMISTLKMRHNPIVVQISDLDNRSKINQFT